MTASINRVGGLLFDQDLIRVQLWTVPLLVCFLLRHYRPQTSALFFAGFSALQLVFGPYLIPIDLLALAMVYAALAHGDTKNTKAFVILSSVMGAFAAFIIDWVTLAAPLFAEDASSDIYPCRAVYLRRFQLFLRFFNIQNRFQYTDCRNRTGLHIRFRLVATSAYGNRSYSARA